jgi:hypothetical protein
MAVMDPAGTPETYIPAQVAMYEFKRYCIDTKAKITQPILME